MYTRSFALLAACALGACDGPLPPPDLSETAADAGLADASLPPDLSVTQLIDLTFPAPDLVLADLSILPDLTALPDLVAVGDFAGVVYPAPHPPMPQQANKGGRRLTAPRLTSITFPRDPQAPRLDAFLEGLPASGWWTATLSEYGVGPGTTTAPVHLNEAAPKRLADADIQTWLAAKLDGTHPEFAPPDDSSLYVIYYPFGTTVTLNNGLSCSSFGGYHSSLKLPSGAHVAYAVLPRCEIGSSVGALESVTGPAAHEIAEAATDADPQSSPAYNGLESGNGGWEFAAGAEVGDLCEFLPHAFYKTNTFDFQVQRTWSNVAARANHDPCVPAPAFMTYFNSAPVLKDTVHVYRSAVPGILAAVGQSATIELDLFSDGPTLPWTVSASTNDTVLGGTTQSLGFAFDRTTGVNGSRLNLTVTVRKAGPSGFESFVILSTLGPITNQWFVVVSDK